MCQNRFGKRVTHEQLAFALWQTQSSATVSEVCRTTGLCELTFYRWKKPFIGMGVLGIRRLTQLEDDQPASLAAPSGIVKVA